MKFGLAQLLTVAIVAVSALAAPAKRRVSPTMLRQLRLYAQWSAAAYCSENINGTNMAVSCSAENCPDVQSSSTTMLYYFDDIGQFGDATGFLAADNTNRLIVLSFRGSRSLGNLIADINAFMSPCNLCSGCEVHAGFWSTYRAVAAILQVQIDSAHKTYPGYSLIITGHSLGGALALLCGTDLYNKGYSPTMYTYGQPRVGNLALSQFITNLDSLWRTTHTNDPVPNLPPTWASFSHPSPEYWITSGNNVTVTKADIQVIQGVDSTAGNAGVTTSDVSAHDWYLDYIDKCQ